MTTYVLRSSIVADSLRFLRQLPIHQNFAGYLCVKHAAAEQTSTSKLRVNFKPLFDRYFKVEGANPLKPYIILFTDGTPTEANLWFNKNVAGSYAPSSLREDNPFKHTIVIERIDAKPKTSLYTLRHEHWRIAFEELTYGQKIPVVPLAVVLFRDFGFLSEKPSASDLVTVFQNEFGYSSTNPMGPEEFNLLFSDDSLENTHEDWFEALL